MSAQTNWISSPIPNLIDAVQEDVSNYFLYAERLVRRSLICNTLGNIALRIFDERLPNGEGLLTKRRGVSLEEMTQEHLVITDVVEKVLFWGDIPPSGGHLLNQRLFKSNADSCVNAAIHSHPDVLIGMLSQLDNGEFDFVSVDTAIVLGSAPKIFDYGVNPESDVSLLGPDEDFRTSCLLMPNHGVTTLGASLSEAYHRHTSIISEMNRLLVSHLVAGARNRPVRYTPKADTQELYQLGSGFLYGVKPLIAN